VASEIEVHEPADVERARQALRTWAPTRRRRATRLRWVAIALVLVGIGAWLFIHDANGSPDDTQGIVQQVIPTGDDTDLIVLLTVREQARTIRIAAPDRCGCWHAGQSVEIWFSDSEPPQFWNHDPEEIATGILLLGFPCLGAGTYVASRVTRRRGRQAAAFAEQPGRRYHARWWWYMKQRNRVIGVTLEDDDAPGQALASGTVSKLLRTAVDANADARASGVPESVVGFGDAARPMMLVDDAGRVARFRPRGLDFEERNRTRSTVELGLQAEPSDPLTTELTDREAVSIVAFRTLTRVVLFAGLPTLFVLRLIVDERKFVPSMIAIGTILVVMAALAIGKRNLVRRIGERVGRSDLSRAERDSIVIALHQQLYSSSTTRLGPERTRQIQLMTIVPVVAAFAFSLALLLTT
jgi:hypothetical protein